MRHENDRPKMVSWYDPPQLARTGVEVFLSTIFGRFADQRLVRAAVAGPGVIYDYSKNPMQVIELGDAVPTTPEQSPERSAEAAEIWIDYVADVGDGWNSTYGVAYSIAHPDLPLAGPDGKPGPATVRGSVLVFGGDQVYPVATQRDYQRRLVEPYRQAFGDGPYPDVFAIPGNHDWYDSLSSFSRLFCSNEPFAGPVPHPAVGYAGRAGPPPGCRTPQKRSYFALKLPHGWWLLGTDVQLGSDIDGPQMDFFLQVAERIIREGGRAILCTPEPHWLTPKKAAACVPPKERTVLEALEEDVLGGRVVVFIAGDVHHYGHYKTPDGTRKITAGGGGAFLHPTHGQLNAKELDGGFRQEKMFPSSATSRRLGRQNLLFLLWNPYFGLLTAALYLLVLWAAMPAIEEYPSYEDLGLYAKCFPEALGHLLWSSDLRPAYIHHRIFLIGFGVLIALAFALFTDLRGLGQRLLVGSAHGLCHYAAALFIAWLASWLAYHLFLHGTEFDQPEVTAEVTFWQPAVFWYATAFTFVAGWVVGSFLMGFYLFVMLNVFRRHYNEAFSALKICDWKNFLRLHIDTNGKLTIYPIGIRRVARQWRERAGKSGPLLEPLRDNQAELIEMPLEIPAP